MKVLMLGWEFPPFISGGLGTACYGLTRALNRQNVQVLFVLPKAVDSSFATHVRLLSPTVNGPTWRGAAAATSGPRSVPGAQRYALPELEHVTFQTVPSRIVSPYVRQQQQESASTAPQAEPPPQPPDEFYEDAVGPQNRAASGAPLPPAAHVGADYSGDIIGESQRYADLCERLVRGESFDVIHAHDWMTFPAGLRLARVSGKPLVIHVHSTEYDRSGEHVQRDIHEIERRGMHGAMTVICVSYLTRNICVHRYGVPAGKVEVVYNGIDSNGPMQPSANIRRGDKIVLFLGRITMQKGPEYFIAAAKKVLEKVDNVKFVVAGSGDMVQQMIGMAAEMGIGHKVLFTGFLRGGDVERVFNMADVYVMPSVSEPFGIAPLEAIRHDTPVIISRNSGVAEVLRHALKVDFWDINDMADKIIAVLRHPPLSQTLREHADLEVRGLTWDGAATKCRQVYERAILGMNQPGVPIN